jgi:HEAT repeats
LVLLVSWLAAEASTESPRDNLSNTFRSDLTSVSVNFKDGLLSVKSKDGKKMQILRKISEQTGIQLHYPSPIEGFATFSFLKLPVLQVLERLLGPEADFVVRYQDVTDSSLPIPKEIWVIGNKQEGSARKPHNLKTTNVDDVNSRECHGKNETVKSAACAEPPIDKELVDHYITMTTDKDPQIRSQAISALMDTDISDNDAIISAIDTALTDEDAGVRASAVQAVGLRKGTDVMEDLWRALQDPSPEVRVVAVESAESQDQGVALLQEALSDVDKTVRSVAEYRLSQILHFEDTK